jgi:hypothetical protein
MRAKLFLVFAIGLVCVFSAAAQNVVESESTATVNGRSTEVSVVIQNQDKTQTVMARVELIDTNGIVRAAVARHLDVLSGKRPYEFQLSFAGADDAPLNDLAWYRVRYQIGRSAGIMSMSQLISDLFELRVIGTDDLLSGMKYRVRVRAVNPFSGSPIAGVNIESTVDLELAGDGHQSLKLRSTGQTDADGSAFLNFEIPVEAKLGGDGEIKVVGRKNGFTREASEDLNTTEHDVQFLMMTDKPIYQPEQVLSVRGIVLKGVEGKTVLSDMPVEFRIRDEDDTVLFRTTVRSSAFGIASAEWQIPKSVRLGDYWIDVRDENGDDIGRRRVRISRYDLPNFVVEAKPSKPFYLPGETNADVVVHADYLFGKPVTKGKIRVVQENSREWNWKEQKYDIVEGEVREGATDGSGKFTAHFDLTEELEDLKDDEWQKYRDVRFAAYFTDLSTNKTEQRRFDIRISKEPIHVYYLETTDDQNPSLPINAYVSTFYADGTPAQCDVEIRASLDEEKKFRTLGKIRTNSLGAGKIAMPRPKIGDEDDDLDLRLVARDKQGRKGTAEEDLDFDDDEAIQLKTDRAIYKPGETINVSVVSTKKEGPVYLDILNGWTVIDSRFATLKDHRAEFQVPYSDAFKGALKVAAYIEDEDDDLIKASRGIIFPAKRGINVEASFDKEIYKPNEEATVKFSVLDTLGNALESALGIVVLDKAVEERSRTETEFGGMWRDYSDWLGYGKSFGGVNLKDLYELDLSKPISDEMQLVAEIILHSDYYSPSIFHSENYYDEAKSVFAGEISRQFAPISAELEHAYRNRNYLHPVNEESLRSILSDRYVDFDQLQDPWGMPYKAIFTIEKTRDVITIVSAGPDKRFDTHDDFTAFTTGFDYFTAMGKAIDTAVQSYYMRTGKAIRDEKTLYSELGIGQLTDRFGRPYKVTANGEGRSLNLHVTSAGPDGRFDSYSWGDDFDVWTSKIDIFASMEKKIADSQTNLKPKPMNEAEFRASLKAASIDLDGFRDAFGRPLYITVDKTSRYWDKVSLETVQNYGDKDRSERTVITPVTQDIINFYIRSSGPDGKVGTYDDVTFMQVLHVLAERARDEKSVSTVQPVVYIDGNGAIGGRVIDANGAVIPGATITATNNDTKLERSDMSDDNGSFLIANLASGNYTVRCTATGFKATVVTNVIVNSNSTAVINVQLEVGTVSSMVSVTGAAERNDTSSSSMVATRQVMGLPLTAQNTLSLLALRPGTVRMVTRSGSTDESSYTEPNSTPRVREYFPETLLWRPEIVTDSNGRAEVRFRMADNITTWKLYTIASTRNGQIGVSEKEVTAFQSFFVDLDPPKFLTEGDEIYLPTQVRNYTDKDQKVDVTMDKADWLTFLGPDKQQVNVPTGESENAVFGFKAIRPASAGKQRVTAIGQTDSDAIERPVTVRPNGEEIVRTDSRYFTGSTTLSIDFPSNALPSTQSAELKLYPNLMAHVSDSIEGLLHRPYGCGEQTVSSTYPNLMILKFVKNDSVLRRKAQQYLQKGYERLLNYQVADGGFSYWGGKDPADIALTAYALRFLADATPFIEVDENVIERAQEWLVKQQRADGSFYKSYSRESTEDRGRAKILTTYVVRTLAMSEPGAVSAGSTATPVKAALAKGLAYLKQRNAEIDEPYALALFGLASLDGGDVDTARTIAAQLEKMAITEGSSAYWKLETNTPFYGWGTAGRIETTALVLQLLSKIAKLENRPASDAASRGLLFLLRNKDRYGVWYSTQTTINVLDSFLAILRSDGPPQQQNLQIIVNGVALSDIPIAADRIEPVIVDLTGKMLAASNTIEVRGGERSPLMAQLVATHYIDWKDSRSNGTETSASRALRLDYKCDKPNPAVMEDVTCTVDAERIGFRGYGMLLAEIGTPPGADVSRESLEAALQNDWSLSRYDILPDRIVLYMWSKAGGTHFQFKFRPRYRINAQTPASVIYDYYNPEAHATVAPLRFATK